MRDRDVRAELDKSLHDRFDGDASSLIIHELGVYSGASRIDVAVINGRLNGYEIKSDSDTLSRLARQSEAYSQIFDYVYVVCGTGHHDGISKHVPDWWGIMRARETTGGVRLECTRDPLLNPHVNPHALARLLWREEALEILTRRGLADGMRSKPRRVLWDALAKELNLGDLQAQVRGALKARQGWRSAH